MNVSVVLPQLQDTSKPEESFLSKHPMFFSAGRNIHN
jgi:hypothetical protein